MDHVNHADPAAGADGADRARTADRVGADLAGRAAGAGSAGRPGGAVRDAMAGTLTVRPARADELAAVGELTAAAYLADGGVPEFYVEELRDASARAEAAEVLVATDHTGALLGTVTVCLPGTPLAEISRPGEAEFRMLATDPAAQGRGVGRSLVRAVLDRAAELGARRVVLCSTTANHRAHRIYRDLGFRRLPERDWSPTSDIRLLAFARDLA
ncbi:GNAT family N-acetyltransferase [Gandjariella thermophila]|uniref:N-acetyltransferase n=1 Tax=Gandjariella thermophila TaxID=1931992 RepID=A0A4D4JB29_9PSEU|nr:GNAT family N-acetyltransferase [Gandjariella thermophila]GDY31868.1 N-acetyltransferase [Gandjariella thermophila]